MASPALPPSAQRPLLYSAPQLSTAYQADSSFSPRAMRPLYGVTRILSDLLLPQEALPDGLLHISEGGSLEVREDLHDAVPNLLRHYSPATILVALGVLFAVLLPLVGFIFCCCRLSCPGRRPPPPVSRREKRRAACRRGCLGLVLAAVVTGMLFGVVCAFVTNEYMQEGTVLLPNRLGVSLNDTRLYLKNTRIHMHHLLVVNFRELQMNVEMSLNATGQHLVDGLKNMSNASVLDNVAKFVSGLQGAEKDLKTLKNLTEEVQNQAKILEKELTELRETINYLHNKCKKQKSCEDALNSSALVSGADFSQLPDISAGLQDVERVLRDGNLERSINDTQNAMATMEVEVNAKMADVTPQVMKSMKEVERTIDDYDRDVGVVLMNVSNGLGDHINPALADMQGYISEYARYRYYIDAGASATLLLIVLLLSLGLLYGFCGKPAFDDGGYEEDCCSKATGGRWLMLAVAAIFCLGSVLIALVLVHFLLGLAAHQAICQPLRPPRDTPLLKIANSMLLAPLGPSNNNLTQVMTSCHHNKSAYIALGMEKRKNISDLLLLVDKYNIKEQLQKIKAATNVKLEVTLLTPKARSQLQLLATSNSLNNLTAFSSVVGKAILQANLKQLADEIDAIPEQNVPDEVAVDLEKLSKNMRRVQETTVAELEKKADLLNMTAISLHDHLHFQEDTVADAVNTFISELNVAQKEINKNGSDLIEKVTYDIVEELLSKVQGHLEHVVNGTKTSVGACSPLSRAINASLVAVCDEVLLPLNGWWVGAGWCVLLFIPALILAVCLSSLYHRRHSNHYIPAGPDTEYLYDAYSDRDNIPLASAAGKKCGRHYHESFHDNAGGGSAYEYSSRRDHDARYSDMAPKHWDMPNGAPPPPRYLGPEYERPPPYYYPGPGDGGGQR